MGLVPEVVEPGADLDPLFLVGQREAPPEEHDKRELRGTLKTEDRRWWGVCSHGAVSTSSEVGAVN